MLMRSLLVWLLVLGLAAQGAAASTMAFCGPGHADGGVGTPPHAAAHAAHAHQGDGKGAAQEHTHDHDHGGPLASADPHAPASDTGADGGNHKCSACASCCSAGAILNSVLALAAPAVAPTVFFSVVPGVDPYAADGLERPPRTVLA